MTDSQMTTLSHMPVTMIGAPLLPDSPALAQAWCADAAALLPEDADQALISQIAAIIITSPHLQLIAKRLRTTHPLDIVQAAQGHTATILQTAHEELVTALGKSADDASSMRILRHYRQRCYFALAIAELSGRLSVKAQAKMMSEIAQDALQAVLSYLCPRYQIAPDALVILGMGKLGAEELNYSSDIDLIILYDEAHSGARAEDYIKLSRHLISLLSTQTADGFAWRVDLRLRPDPGATAIALSCGAAISYYESIARSWERAVFIRARPVAGNLSLGKAFLAAIYPFIWRRQLDYSILADLKTWITHIPLSQDGMGFDVKRGAYGIRHIEMMTHLLLMLHGGRAPALQSHRTDDALMALADAGHLTTAQANKSITFYWQWRQLEHRLQYCRDAHLYHLPTSQEEFTKFARFVGCQDGPALTAHITALQEATCQAASHQIMQDMIAAHLGDIASGAWPAEAEGQHDYLTKQGFERPDEIIRTIDSWMSGRYPATRSERARACLQELLPVILAQMAKSQTADAHFIGFAQFLEALPSGVQILTLLSHHPQLIQLIITLTLNAPALMQELTKSPYIFEEMIDEQFFAPLTMRPDFSAEIQQAVADKPLEDKLDIVRRYAKDMKFRAAAHIITYPETAQEAPFYLSDLADACLVQSFTIARDEFARKHGHLRGAQFAILLLGRAGHRTLTPRSDIDLIFLYEGDSQVMSDGPQPLSLTHYFQKLAMRLVNWTTAQTASGTLYEIDTRLRPDGKAGPLATHFDGWQSYLADKAWPFERLALHKARLLPDFDMTSQLFADKIKTTIANVTATPPSRKALCDDIKLLRDKLASQSPAQWDFKKQKGGLLDCEFAYHLTGKMPTLYDHLMQLSLVASVMRPEADSVPPLSFQTELCRLTAIDDFNEAMVRLTEERLAIATEIEQALAL